MGTHVNKAASLSTIVLCLFSCFSPTHAEKQRLSHVIPIAEDAVDDDGDDGGFRWDVPRFPQPAYPPLPGPGGDCDGGCPPQSGDYRRDRGSKQPVSVPPAGPNGSPITKQSQQPDISTFYTPKLGRNADATGTLGIDYDDFFNRSYDDASVDYKGPTSIFSGIKVVELGGERFEFIEANDQIANYYGVGHRVGSTLTSVDLELLPIAASQVIENKLLKFLLPYSMRILDNYKDPIIAWEANEYGMEFAEFAAFQINLPTTVRYQEKAFEMMFEQPPYGPYLE